MTRVYASLPLSGPSGDAGREVLEGAEQAIERAGGAAPELVVIDTGGEGREARAEDAARMAAGDDQAVAYLGDFHSSQVAATAPILGAAGLLQVAPVATSVELGGPTLICPMPDDRVGACAIADWLTEAGVSDLLVVHDYGDQYGVPVGTMCVDAARGRGLTVRSRPVWNHDERPAEDLGEAQAVLYVGVAGSGAAQLWHDLHALRPEMWLLGSEGVAVSWFAEALSPGAAARTRLFVAPTAPLGSYDRQAMELILDAVADGGPDRATIVREARVRHVPTSEYGCLAVVDGKLVSA
jgi:ABC-type branched-subunit amino acid transport system substrate-binding protein